MINNSRKLVEMTAQEHKAAVPGRRRRRFSFTKDNDAADSTTRTTMLADKGHFVVYTSDERRFEVPLAYLNNPIFKDLLKMSEDEFGLTCCGPIRLPCTSDFMEHTLSKIRPSVAKDILKSLRGSIRTDGFSRPTFQNEPLSSK